MARNPWKKLMSNVKLSANYGCFGGSSRNPKNRDGKKRGSQSTKTHQIFVDWEDLKEQFEKQNEKCFWLGIPLNPDWVFKSHFIMAPSVDRISNEGEYTKDNIVICCRFANIGRRNTEPNDFAQIVRLIAEKGIVPPTQEMMEELQRTEDVVASPYSFGMIRI